MNVRLTYIGDNPSFPSQRFKLYLHYKIPARVHIYSHTVERAVFSPFYLVRGENCSTPHYQWFGKEICYIKLFAMIFWAERATNNGHKCSPYIKSYLVRLHFAHVYHINMFDSLPKTKSNLLKHADEPVRGGYVCITICALTRYLKQ